MMMVNGDISIHMAQKVDGLDSCPTRVFGIKPNKEKEELSQKDLKSLV